MESLVRLTHQEVSRLWQQRAAVFTQDQCSLKDLKEIDSSGIAFLVQWAKSRPHQQLTLLQVPDNARRLITTFKLESLFKLD